MAQKAIHKPGNVLAIVVFALITLFGITLRNRKIEQLNEPAEAVATSTVSTSRQPGGQADSLSTTIQRPLSASDDLSVSLWKAVGYTALILGLIIGIAWAARKYGGDRFSQTSTPDIEIVGRKYLNPKQSLAIVRVRGKELLLGISDHSIQLLSSLDTDEE